VVAFKLRPQGSSRKVIISFISVSEPASLAKLPAILLNEDEELATLTARFEYGLLIKTP